jgi:hypothetical protein
MHPTDQLIPRAQLLQELSISDSSERRRRKAGGDNWPPHITIGKKVYYRRCRVDEWIARREARADVANHDLPQEVEQALDRRAAELAAAAPALTPQRKIALRSVFPRPAGGGSR